MALFDSSTEGITKLLKILSKPDALRILFFADQGIRNSTHVIEELGLSQKKYYTRLNELLGEELLIKREGIYRQTALGNIICNRFLPAMGMVFAAKDKLELLMHLEESHIEPGMRKLIEEELKIPNFTRSTNVVMLESYEALAIQAIDLYDSAEERAILASNYMDVRVMEASFRAVERDVICSCIVGKKNLSSELKKLRTMLSLTFMKTIIHFTSKKVNIKEFLRFVDVPYTFCVVDGQHSIIEVSNPINERFMFALLIDDEGVAEKLTEFYEILWGAGEFKTFLNVLTSIGIKLNGDAPQ